MGYDVDQRQVTLGEDLSAYDEIIVFIAGPRQLVATTVYEGLWAISQRPNCILAYDDWQVPDLFKGVEKAGVGDELFAPFILDVNKKTLEELKPFEKELRSAIATIVEKKSRMLISAFQTGHLNNTREYGAHLLFGKIDYPRDRMFVYNPNPYHRNRTWENIGHEGMEDPTWKPSALNMSLPPRPEKERRFNFASLVQSKTSRWLKKSQSFITDPADDERGCIMAKTLTNIYKWPVDLYGSKAETQKRLTEDEMVKVITRDWGCLMPGYDHAGSGWWRARPLQCADAGSILIGEDQELAVYYGEDYPFYGLKATDLLELSDEDLRTIATAQREAIYKIHPLDKQVQRTEIQAILEAPK